MELVSLKQLFQRLSGGGRLLGLDVGSRNIGLAVSDPKCRIASPHSVMYRSNTTTLKNISRLESLVQEMNITGLVIGYPLELTGFQGKQGAQVKLFAKELQMSCRFPNLAYVYWDERLTSVAVTNVIGSMDITGRRRKNIVDKMSALCILQLNIAAIRNLWGYLILQFLLDCFIHRCESCLVSGLLGQPFKTRERYSWFCFSTIVKLDDFATIFSASYCKLIQHKALESVNCLYEMTTNHDSGFVS